MDFPRFLLFSKGNRTDKDLAHRHAPSKQPRTHCPQGWPSPGRPRFRANFIHATVRRCVAWYKRNRENHYFLGHAPSNFKIFFFIKKSKNHIFSTALDTGKDLTHRHAPSKQPRIHYPQGWPSPGRPRFRANTPVGYIPPPPPRLWSRYGSRFVQVSMWSARSDRDISESNTS